MSMGLASSAMKRSIPVSTLKSLKITASLAAAMVNWILLLCVCRLFATVPAGIAGSRCGNCAMASFNACLFGPIVPFLIAYTCWKVAERTGFLVSLARLPVLSIVAVWAFSMAWIIIL